MWGRRSGGTLLPPQSVNWKYCGMILAQRLQGIAIPQAIRPIISFIHRVHASFLFKYSNRAGGAAREDSFTFCKQLLKHILSTILGNKGGNSVTKASEGGN